VREPFRAGNVDLLAWFSLDERELCEACFEQAAVSVPEAVASFFLSCGAVAIDAVRVDVDGRLDLALGDAVARSSRDPGERFGRVE
jgi:hypothetical protein